jgi:predicted lipase
MAYWEKEQLESFVPV